MEPWARDLRRSSMAQRVASEHTSCSRGSRPVSLSANPLPDPTMRAHDSAAGSHRAQRPDWAPAETRCLPTTPREASIDAMSRRRGPGPDPGAWLRSPLRGRATRPNRRLRAGSKAQAFSGRPVPNTHDCGTPNAAAAYPLSASASRRRTSAAAVHAFQNPAVERLSISSGGSFQRESG